MGTLDFAPFDDLLPFDEALTVVHPRFRAFGGRLYVASQAKSNNRILATYLTSANGTWHAPVTVSYPAFYDDIELSDRSLRLANQFSFAIGDDPSGATKLRVIYTRETKAKKRYVDVVQCDWGLDSKCYPTEWSTKNTPGDQFSPLIFAAGSPSVWKSVWLSRQSDPRGNMVEVRQSNYAVLGLPPAQTFFATELVPPQAPCEAGTYWGDYNDLTQLIKPQDLGASPRFITAFTRNGLNGECSFRNEWTADMHVGARVFK